MLSIKNKSFVIIRKYSILVLPLLFLFYSAPSALDYIFFHADEKRYTDAVVHMMDNDEYFTPFKADGETPRFKKPIVTYWVLMSGFKLFGISPWGARFFFWITGALLVVITYLMSESFFRNKKVSVLAAFIVGANPLVMMSASRTIPDILLTFFVTLSAWGFLEIMLKEKPQKGFYWMAYLGTALAFETKGVPAIAYFVVSILFLLLNPWKKTYPKKLYHLPSILTSVFIAFGWYVLMYIQHGASFLNVFFADQVGDRVISKMTQSVTNGALAGISLFVFLVPWIIMFFSKSGQLKKHFVESSNHIKSIAWFIATWVLLTILMSAAVFKFYDRYILPCLPVVSIIIAYRLAHLKISFQKPVFNVLFSLNIFVLLVALLYFIFISQNVVLFIGILTALALNITYFRERPYKKVSKNILIANLLMLIYFTTHTTLHPILTPVPAKQLVTKLNEHIDNRANPIYVYGHIGIPANMRIQSHGNLNIISMDTIYKMPQNPNHVIVFKEDESNRLDLNNYDIFPGSEELPGLSAQDFPLFLQERISHLKNSTTKYLIGKPIINAND